MDRIWRCVGFLTVCVFLLTGCDPEEMVKRKTPAPLKSVLQFVEKKAQQKQEGEAPKPEPEIDIVRPLDKGFAPEGVPITFEATVDCKGLTIQDNQLTWKLMTLTPSPEKGKPPVVGQPKSMGKGKAARTELAAGQYQVEFSLTHPESKTPPKRITFKVGTAISGEVKHDNEPLVNTRVSLVDMATRQEVASGLSGKDGAFFVELPFQADFRLTPHRQGYAFDPQEALVRKGERPQKAEFTAVKATVEGMKLTASADSDEPLFSVCPFSHLIFKARINCEHPLKSLTVAMIPVDVGAVPVTLGEWHANTGSSRAEGDGKADFNAVVPVTVPIKVFQGPKRTEYRLRLIATRDMGGGFSCEAAGNLLTDVSTCMTKMLSDAIDAHTRGELEAALKIYDLLEDMTREQLTDEASITLRADKILFNEGLAYLMLAIAPDTEEAKRQAHAARALTDFKELVRLRRNDAAAFMLMGLALNVRKDHQGAVDALNTAVTANPKVPEAYELRGLSRLGMGSVNNLSRAIDDFTESLSRRPNNDELRKLRAACLVMDLNQEGQSEGGANFDSLPRKKTDAVLKLDEFIRGRAQ